MHALFADSQCWGVLFLASSPLAVDSLTRPCLLIGKIYTWLALLSLHYYFSRVFIFNTHTTHNFASLERWRAPTVGRQPFGNEYFLRHQLKGNITLGDKKHQTKFLKTFLLHSLWLVSGRACIAISY